METATLPTEIICCPKCNRVRIFGVWKKLSLREMSELDKHPGEWKKTPIFCGDCQATLPKR